MTKIKIEKPLKTVDDLIKISEELKKENKNEYNSIKEKILLCMGGGCLASGAMDLKEILTK